MQRDIDTKRLSDKTSGKVVERYARSAVRKQYYRAIALGIGAGLRGAALRREASRATKAHWKVLRFIR